LHAWTQPIPGQVLETDAPKLLTDRNFAADEFLRYALSNDLPEIGAPQIELLLADDPLKKERNSNPQPTLGESKEIAGRQCQQVVFTRPDGKLVYWIDEESHILRRVDFPVTELKKKLDPEGKMTELRAWLDLSTAQLGQPVDSRAFDFEAPEGVTLVRKFVPPPGAESEQAAYEKALAEASIGGPTKMVEVLRAKIAPRSEPTTLAMSPLWTCAEVKEPGNLLAVEIDGRPRVVVLDGWRQVVEIDAEGKVLGRHELKLPESAAVSFIRTAVDGEGRRFYALSSGRQQQLYLFDQEWKLVLAYPTEEHPGIGDVQIGDVEGKGTLDLLVGFWGVVGVQRVSLDGERIWSNRSVENVLQLALAGAASSDGNSGGGGRRIECVTTRGTITPIDAAGKQSADIRIPNRALTALVVHDVDGDGAYEGCALAAVPDNDSAVVAIGLDAAGAETWTYELPPGYHETPIERIVAARLPGEGGWLLPAADGSIHLLTTEGQLVDRFNYGAVLSAAAIASFETENVLLVSAPGGVAAWSIAPSASKPAAGN
jgi:hypothetical protein